jgi:hypothetical protein
MYKIIYNGTQGINVLCMKKVEFVSEHVPFFLVPEGCFSEVDFLLKTFHTIIDANNFLSKSSNSFQVWNCEDSKSAGWGIKINLLQVVHM